MNIFINIHTNWTIYEWILLGGTLILIFLLTNLATYLLTKDWRFITPITLTYLMSSSIYILLVFLIHLFLASISSFYLIPILAITFLITINWTTLISYYNKFRNNKNFTMLKLNKEYKKDSIRNIVFLTFAILSVSIFLRNNLLYIFIIIYITSVSSIFINTLLVKRFIHD